MVTRRRRVITDVTRAPDVSRPPVDTARLGPVVDLGRFARKTSTNLFDGSKPGRPVVRADDLLALRIELVNLSIVAGNPPQLKRAAAGPARIILHFPPQAIAEEAVYESPGAIAQDTKGTATSRTNPLPPPPSPPSLSDPIPGRPLKARIAGESRLSFVVPDNAGWAIGYTLDKVLDACSRLPLDVVTTAKERSTGPVFGPFIDWIKTSKQYLEKLPAGQRARLSTLALRTARIAAQEGRAGAPTLRVRAGLPGGLVAPAPSRSAPGTPIDIARAITDGQINGRDIRRPTKRGPRPTAPGAQQTAIELPWRLTISPHGGARWQHAMSAVSSPLTQRTELWHTRLTTLDSNGVPFDYPEKDSARTIRAVWARMGEGSSVSTFDKDYPNSNRVPPDATTVPFLGALDDSDRFDFVHLSSNFSFSNYQPEVVDVNALMLTALGGWLDSRGAWDPPAGFSVEEWVHRASMARDHYVRVVRKGFLFPFGHRVSLVKVTERKFHAGVAGNAAVLRQRTFIIVRERERTYTLTTVKNSASDGSPRSYDLQFPFSRVRMLTTVTPDLDDPRNPPSAIPGAPAMKMFYPHLSNTPQVPFRFRCAATDLDGRNIEFEMPMIFIENSLAAVAIVKNGRIDIDYAASLVHFKKAKDEWRKPDRAALRKAEMRLQSMALAASIKPGDTLCEVQEIEFGAETDNLIPFAKQNGGLQCYPAISSVKVKIPALSGLSGAADFNVLKFEPTYLDKGFDTANKGEVFMAVDTTATANTAKLDFSKQGDRSGGFVMPNLNPTGLSRLAGPVSGPLAGFAGGNPSPVDFFKDLSPLLFGVIPLGEVVSKIAAGVGSPSMPTFLTEAATKVESFVNDLVRLLDLLRRLPEDANGIGAAAAEVVGKTLKDLENQAITQLDTGQGLIAQYRQRIGQARADVEALVSWLALNGTAALNNPASLAGQVDPLLVKLANLANAANAPVGVPAGFVQSVTSIAGKARATLDGLKTVAQLVASGKNLLTAVEALVGDPTKIASLFDPKSTTLLPLVQAVNTELPGFRSALAGNSLLDGAPKQTLLSVLDALIQMLSVVTKVLELFGGEEMVLRFDWKPELSPWPSSDPIFRPNDKNGFVVAVEGRVKRNGAGTPKVNVVCSLKHFDLILIGSAGFMELNFEKIEFKADSSAKMNVDVLLTDIKFIGVLSFVETLRDLIPLDGFSDPPYLDISSKGIDAGFDIALPNIAVGIFSLTNLSLGAGFSVPFIGQPLSVRFNFCTREQPFNLTVALFGGGGFFGITVDPKGVQILEAAFEFGASISVNFGVASGGVHVMAGIYFRMEQSAAQLSGYFRLGGHVSVLGLVSASLELYLELRYEFQTGKAVGKAQLTIEISILMFSASVTITCERKFAGSNGDPTFAQLMGPESTEVLTDTLKYPWRDYCEAFA